MSAVLTLRPKKPAVPPVLRTAARLLSELQPGQSAVINGLTWAGYQWLDRKRDEVRPKLKLAYHRGSLELMVVSFFHDDISGRLQTVVRHACAAPGIPCGHPVARRSRRRMRTPALSRMRASTFRTRRPFAG